MAEPRTPELCVRGSEGVTLTTFEGAGFQRKGEPTAVSRSRDCRVSAFSPDGSQLAWCDGQSVQVLDLVAGTTKCAIPKPKTRHLRFSPKGTYLALWEPYVVTKDTPSGTPNLQVWTTEKVAEFTQKKQQDWCPQWSQDEHLCGRNVTNEVQCYDDGRLGGATSHKLHVQGLATFALSPGLPPYKLSIYVPGSKGAPSFVRLYEYPRLEGAGAIVASKSFYRADSVNFFWNKKGMAVLVLTTSDVDKTGASYYGEQSLHYLSARGDGNMVPLDKKGPIYVVNWNPNSEEFCAIYGFMPSKATLFNCRCEPVHDFGIGHRNVAHFNPHGNILFLAGFGNLRGNMEFWDRKDLKVLSKPQAPDTTQVEWCPDGIHVVTATTAPRLREGNGFKVWHFTGALVYEEDTAQRQELWEVSWRPCPQGVFPAPDTSVSPPPSSVSLAKPQAKPTQAYRPPALRGKPSQKSPWPADTLTGDSRLAPVQQQEEVAQGTEDKEKLSRSAQRNRRKKEAKQKAKQLEGAAMVDSGRGQDQRDAVAMAAHLFGGNGAGGGGGGGGAVSEREKKLKNLRKKLRQVEQLKQQQEEGKQLEANQIEKIKSEQSLLEEIAKLEV